MDGLHEAEERNDRNRATRRAGLQSRENDMKTGTIDRAYESVRGALPEDANRLLDQQIPKVEEFIDAELSKFGLELSAFIGAEVDRLLAESSEASQRAHNELIALIGEIRADVAADDAVLERAVEKLERNLGDYERRFDELGERVRRGVADAMRAAGVPVSGA